MPPPVPPDLGLVPATIVAGVDASIVVDGAAAADGAVAAFLPQGDASCDGAAALKLYPTGGMLRGGALTVHASLLPPSRLVA